MEAVKQGSAAVGLKNRTHAILVALKVRCNIIQFAYLSFFYSFAYYAYKVYIKMSLNVIRKGDNIILY